MLGLDNGGLMVICVLHGILQRSRNRSALILSSGGKY